MNRVVNIIKKNYQNLMLLKLILSKNNKIYLCFIWWHCGFWGTWLARFSESLNLKKNGQNYFSVRQQRKSLTIFLYLLLWQRKNRNFAFNHGNWDRWSHTYGQNCLWKSVERSSEKKSTTKWPEIVFPLQSPDIQKFM